MRWIKTILTIVGTTILGMAGGQGKKGMRRFGLPAFAMSVGKFSKRTLPLILLIPLLSIGYGEGSWLMAWLGQDWLVRGVYALMLSSPFLFYGWQRWLVACIALIAMFQIHAGSLGNIGGMDILIEDIARYLTLGVLIVFVLFRKDSA